MTQKQITLIKNSWKVFRIIDTSLVGDVFYSRLFLETPSLRSMFTNKMSDQYSKLIDMLSYIVSKVDNLTEMDELLKELAVRHAAYGVRPSHYSIVGKTLLWTLEKGLGKDWNNELHDAWTLCYSHISHTMIRAAYPNEKHNA